MPTPASQLRRKVALAVAPNGARRTKTDHPALPMTAAELARTAAESLEAGAAMIHLHVRDAAGGHVLDADLTHAAIAAVREAVGQRLVIQVTTEAVGRYKPPEQMALVRALKPEAVSLALRELCPDAADEHAFAAFLEFLQRERIAPQYILYDPPDVARMSDFVKRGLIPDARPAVIHVLGRYLTERTAAPTDLLPMLAAGNFPQFMVCAFGPNEAACGVTAALLGGDVRVGFENNLHLPNGSLAPDNAALIAAVARPLAALGFATADADDMRASFGF